MPWLATKIKTILLSSHHGPHQSILQPTAGYHTYLHHLYHFVNHFVIASVQFEWRTLFNFLFQNKFVQVSVFTEESKVNDY